MSIITNIKTNIKTSMFGIDFIINEIDIYKYIGKSPLFSCQTSLKIFAICQNEDLQKF